MNILDENLNKPKLAESIHFGQVRRGGEPFIRHPERVTGAIRNRGVSY